jgi:hypothetical protein
VEHYDEAVQLVQDNWVKLRIIEREKEMQAFMIYHQEIADMGMPTNSDGGEKQSKRMIESTKAQWDALSS